MEKVKTEPKKPGWWPYSWNWKSRKHLWDNPMALENFKVHKGLTNPYVPAIKPVWWPAGMENNQELWDNPVACERLRQNLALKQMKREKNHVDYGYFTDDLLDLNNAEQKKCTIQ
jgi:hypothetical protein